MPDRLALVTILVHDIETAKSWFENALHFTCIEDKLLAPGKRWTVMRPDHADGGADLLLKEGIDDGVGKQGGGKVWLFLETSDFEARYAGMEGAGVQFLEKPRDESYGKVVQFVDISVNKWDMIQRK